MNIVVPQVSTSLRHRLPHRPTQGPEALLLVFPYSMSMALSRAARYL